MLEKNFGKFKKKNFGVWKKTRNQFLGKNGQILKKKLGKKFLKKNGRILGSLKKKFGKK